ncbi:MAG: hypothetical protein ACO39B_15960, partial [bacterium]
RVLAILRDRSALSSGPFFSIRQGETNNVDDQAIDYERRIFGRNRPSKSQEKHNKPANEHNAGSLGDCSTFLSCSRWWT